MSLKLKLIGYPIKHSLSPWIQTSFLERSGLEGSYRLHEIASKEIFGEEMKKLREEEVNGFNITVPYKQTIIPYLDRIDITAERVGAVNTVSLEGNEWVGYNTDGIGYVQALRDKFPDMDRNIDVPILILGAGGAARGIFHGLIQAGYTNLTLANRTKSKCEDIMKGTSASVITLAEAEKNIAAYDVIIQTSSVGMEEAKQIVDLSNLKAGTIVSDIVYQPLVTQFLKQAAEKGGRIHYGHTMLLYQAQKAFEIWTNKNVDVTGMDEEMITKIKGDKADVNQ
ncbi:shikimate dehydrogenase [Oceanobacillus oncorhynchi subsp. incaldanensis]|uniref:Shikimate dehydrogenase (NADP(+)) n=1 Tax=Oceanobacillus aidingensis TaxID=645964 RepID=A0ABV9K4C8_9BACI|nr:shikimate dehydrogenase [Oceanobacillus oncorhynchi]MDM8099345.1 shikimate dehydrogenase [Oceanobacillus oncorhynchi]UUI38526.1 shikimate dehydrogenase [Oceanobacillus oncorhynchi]GIO19731.1 shikimate dehydrogenase [Oceanobacillus oncorhynchi subsp. incaldanensis]